MRARINEYVWTFVLYAILISITHSVVFLLCMHISLTFDWQIMTYAGYEWLFYFIAAVYTWLVTMYPVRIDINIKDLFIIKYNNN